MPGPVVPTWARHANRVSAASSAPSIQRWAEPQSAWRAPSSPTSEIGSGGSPGNSCVYENVTPGVVTPTR